MVFKIAEEGFYHEYYEREAKSLTFIFSYLPNCKKGMGRSEKLA